MVTIKELENEIELKNKRIKDLIKEKQNAEKAAEEECNALRDELDLSKEKIVQLSENQAILVVYKKKIESMAQLKSELKDLQERN